MQDWVIRLGSLVIFVGGRSYEVVCGWNGAYKRHVRFPFITSYRHPIPTLLLAFYKLSSTTLLAWPQSWRTVKLILGTPSRGTPYTNARVQFILITSYRYPIPTIILEFYKLSSTTLLAWPQYWHTVKLFLGTLINLISMQESTFHLSH